MSGKESPQNVIDTFQKRQKMMPFLVGGLAVALLLVGVIILVIWLSGPNKPLSGIFASATPTATATLPPTPVLPTPEPTNTEAPLPTMPPTETATPSGPQEYTVKEGDICNSIATTFNTTVELIIAQNNLKPNCNIQIGQKILIPAPGAQLPTKTAVPLTLPRGTKIEYTVELGDTIAKIAAKFNSTYDAIVLENKLKDPNKILAGDVLKIPVNIATVVPTRAATVTPSGSPAAKGAVVNTATPAATVTGTRAP